MINEAGVDAGFHTCACSCPGATVWFTGLSGSADLDLVLDLVLVLVLVLDLAEQLRARGRRVVVLDADDTDVADESRHPLPGKRLTPRHLGVVAEVLARNGVITLIRAPSSATESREAARRRHEASDTAYLEVELVGPESHQQPTGSDLRLEIGSASSAAVCTLLAERGVVR